MGQKNPEGAHLRSHNRKHKPSDRSEAASPQRHHADHEHRQRDRAAAVEWTAFAAALAWTVQDFAAAFAIIATVSKRARFRAEQEDEGNGGNHRQENPEGAHLRPY
jgi:hypothetical protein